MAGAVGVLGVGNLSEPDVVGLRISPAAVVGDDFADGGDDRVPGTRDGGQNEPRPLREGILRQSAKTIF